MSTDSEKRRWALAILLVPLATLLVFLALVGISAQGLSLGEGSAGSIRLEGVSLRLGENGQWYLNAKVNIDLPEPIKAGLDSGVPLDFNLDLQFQRVRSYWPDKTLASYRHRFRLTYYELTRHYRVDAIDTDISRNYRSFSAALAGLGVFERLPVVIDTDDKQRMAVLGALASEGVVVNASLDFSLDSKSLPLPMQPLISSSWRLSSKEYQWQVN